MPIFGLTQGLQPIVGFNYGAGRYDRVMEAIRRATLYGTVLATAAFVTLMFGTRPVLRMFTTDADLIERGVPIIRTLMMALPLVGFQMVGSSSFQALGKARPAFVLNVSRHALLLPFVLTLPRMFGLPALWGAFPAADGIAVAITAVWVAVELRELRSRANEGFEGRGRLDGAPKAGGHFPVYRAHGLW
jgi:Na+-driven multidrug efflux pump